MTGKISSSYFLHHRLTKVGASSSEDIVVSLTCFLPYVVAGRPRHPCVAEGEMSALGPLWFHTNWTHFRSSGTQVTDCELLAHAWLVAPWPTICIRSPSISLFANKIYNSPSSKQAFRPLFRTPSYLGLPTLLQHVYHCADAVARLHDLESIVDLRKGLAVRNELVNLELALEVITNKVWQLRAALDTTKGAALPDTTSHKLECCTGSQISLILDTNWGEKAHV